jgi:EpsG family
VEGLSFEALRTTWVIALLGLAACVPVALSSRFSRLGLSLACAIWAIVFVSAGLRSEQLNSDTESYVSYVDQATDNTSLSDYVDAQRLEPAWSAMVYVSAAVLASPRNVLLLCAIATMLLLLVSFRTLGALAPVAMLHYLAEFYLNNDTAIVRHSFATALSMAIIVGLQSPAWAGRRLPLSLLAVPPFFHVASVGILASVFGAKGSYVRISLAAAAVAILAWILLRTAGATLLPERVLEFDPENTREIRGFFHLALLTAVVLLDATALRSAIERNPKIAFCYLAGVGLSFAVIGFPLLSRVRQVLLQFGVLFYPLVLARITRPPRFWLVFAAYAAFITGVAVYTVSLLTDKYNAGFF